MYKTRAEGPVQYGSKNWLKYNMKTVQFWLLFLQNTNIVKLNFLQCLDAIAMEILSPKIWINEIFS